MDTNLVSFSYPHPGRYPDCVFTTDKDGIIKHHDCQRLLNKSIYNSIAEEYHEKIRDAFRNSVDAVPLVIPYVEYKKDGVHSSGEWHLIELQNRFIWACWEDPKIIRFDQYRKQKGFFGVPVKVG